MLHIFMIWPNHTTFLIQMLYIFLIQMLYIFLISEIFTTLLSFCHGSRAFFFPNVVNFIISFKIYNIVV